MVSVVQPWVGMVTPMGFSLKISKVTHFALEPQYWHLSEGIQTISGTKLASREEPPPQKGSLTADPRNPLGHV